MEFNSEDESEYSSSEELDSEIEEEDSSDESDYSSSDEDNSNYGFTSSEDDLDYEDEDYDYLGTHADPYQQRKHTIYPVAKPVEHY